MSLYRVCQFAKESNVLDVIFPDISPDEYFDDRLGTYLYRWMMKKYKRLNTWKKATTAMLKGVERHPNFFAHWPWVKPAVK